MRFSRIAAALAAVAASGCTDIRNCSPEEARSETQFVLSCGPASTKSEAPTSETEIRDLNVFIFNSAGQMEEALFLHGDGIEATGGETGFRARLVRGMNYSIYVCANLSYRPSLKSLEEVLAFRYWMTRPDDYRSGIPMSGHVDRFTAGEGTVRIPLTRAMTKVTIDLDRSRLDGDVSYRISSVRVGNCPRSVPMFGKGSVRDEDDIFPAGFSCDAVPATVYLLENSGPAREELASFIEIEAEYESDSLYTKEGGHLVYRFHVEDSEGHSVERNTAYRVTVIPEGKGLGGNGWSDSWRIDKGDLAEHHRGEPMIRQFPSSYIECRIGDVIHLGCEIYPPDTPFDIGMEYLEEDHANGLYDFEVDESGTGVWLTMKEGGMGWIYMEAGDPIDDAALFVIMCEP